MKKSKKLRKLDDLNFVDLNALEMSSVVGGVGWQVSTEEMDRIMGGYNQEQLAAASSKFDEGPSRKYDIGPSRKFDEGPSKKFDSSLSAPDFEHHSHGYHDPEEDLEFYGI